MARSVLEFILKTIKTGKGVKQVEGDLKKLDKGASKTKRSFSLMDGATLNLGGRVNDLAIQVLRSIPQMVRQGVEAQRARKSLEGYAGGSEQAAEMVEALKEATGGGISEMTAMGNASKLLSMGLATNATEAAELTKIAITLGASMGKGPQQAFEEFTLLLANQSILRLDTFGISAGTVRQRMAELAKEGIEPADRQARFLIATMEEAETSMTALDAAGFEATSSLDRFDATVADTKQGVAEFLAEGLMPWIDGIFAVKDAIGEQNIRVAESTATFEEYYTLINENVITSLTELTEAEYNEIKAEQLQRESLETSTDLLVGPWRSALSETITDTDNLKGSTDLLTGSNDALRLSIIGLSEAAIAEAAIRSLKEAEDEGIITSDEYNEALIFIHTSMLGTPEAQIKASEAVGRISDDFLTGHGDAMKFAGQVERLGRSVESLKSKRIDIRVHTRYTQSGQPGRGGRAIRGPARRGQFGLDMIAPPGYPNDTFPVMVSSGERVKVTPASEVNNITNNTFNLTARYALQSEVQLAADVRMLEVLYGS